jgi:hypothetical protein
VSQYLIVLIIETAIPAAAATPKLAAPRELRVPALEAAGKRDL